MSKSLAIVNGDLAIGPGRAFETVSGKQKLLQDLRLWVLERIGLDPSTPTFGSRFDGGFINGEEVSGFVGQIDSQEMLMAIRNETIELIQRYQAMQFDKIRNEAIMFGGDNTLDEGEVIDSIDDINVKSIGTTVLVQVRLLTIDGSALKLTIPVE